MHAKLIRLSSLHIPATKVPSTSMWRKLLDVAWQPINVSIYLVGYLMAGFLAMLMLMILTNDVYTLYSIQTLWEFVDRASVMTHSVASSGVSWLFMMGFLNILLFAVALLILSSLLDYLFTGDDKQKKS